MLPKMIRKTTSARIECARRPDAHRKQATDRPIVALRVSSLARAPLCLAAIMEKNNAIADPAINPTMNDLETGRFHA